MRKNHHTQKQAPQRGFPPEIRGLKNTVVDVGTTPFAIIVNEHHTNGMAKTTTGKAPQSG